MFLEGNIVIFFVGNFAGLLFGEIFLGSFMTKNYLEEFQGDDLLSHLKGHDYFMINFPLVKRFEPL